MATDEERLLVRIEAQLRQFERQMASAAGTADRTANRIERRFSAMDRQLAGLGKNLFAGFLAGAGALALSRLPETIRGIVKEAADIGDVAERVGLTAEQLQKLNFQAKQTGSSAETMASALEVFGKRLGDARSGAGDLFKILKANGVTLDQLAKMDVNDALVLFVDLIGRAKDEADALTISAAGFGRGAGADMALTFRDGATGMKEFGDQAARTGQIIKDDLIDQAQEIDDKFDQLTGTISTMVKGGLLEFLSTTRNELEGIRGVLNFLRRAGRGVNAAGAGARAGETIGARSNIDEAFRAVDELKEDSQLLAALQKKLTIAPGGAEPTNLPPPPPPPKTGGGGGGGRTPEQEFQEELRRIRERTRFLQIETSVVGQNTAAREDLLAIQALINQAEDAGLEITADRLRLIEEEAAAYSAAVAELENAETRFQAINDLANEFGNQAIDAFEGLVDGTKTLNESLADTLKMLRRMVLEGLLLGQGPLAALLGGGGGAGVGGLFGSLFGGFRANGGSVFPGHAYVVGERGPELLMPSAAGRVAPLSGHQLVETRVHVEASPLFVTTVDSRARQAEASAVARAPAAARDLQRRFATP